MVTRSAVGLAAAVLAATACSSFDASPVEAASDPSDASSASDGHDAGSGSPADAGPTTAFCAMRPGAFACEDFEGVSGFGLAWKADNEDGRNTVSVVELPGAPSPAHALFVEADVGGTLATDAYLKLANPPIAQKVTIEGQMELVAGAGDRCIFLEVHDDAKLHFVRLRTSGEIEEALAVDGGSPVKTTRGILPPPTLGKWTSVSLTIDAKSRLGVARIGGQTKEFAIDGSWQPAVMVARFGIVDGAPDTKWSAHWDDVAVSIVE